MSRVQWLDSLDEAKKKALEQHKSVLLDFFSPT